MIRDCIGEVANIIAGQAKTLLYGTPLHFNFSPPIQDDFEPPSEAEALQLTFGSDAGGFTLTVHPPTAIES
jgi:CheY-specific phosphatase CheX